MHEVRRREAFGNNVTGFHQLQSEFQSVGIIETPPDYNRVIDVRITLRMCANLRIQFERLVYVVRDAVQRVEIDIGAESICQQIKGDQLAGVRFSGRDALLTPSLYQKTLAGN